MLKQRVITAVILFSVLLVATVFSPTPWPLLLVLTVMSGATIWEWLRLSCSNNWQKIALPIAIVSSIFLILLAAQILTNSPSSIGMAVINFLNNIAVPVTALIWIFGVSLAVIKGHTQTRQHSFVLSVFAILASLVLWYSLSVLYLSFGALFLLSLMALIWAADTSAYFTGKAFGKRKLAPKISPGKTIEGAVGGLLGALVLMTLSAFWPNSFAYYLVYSWGFTGMVVITILLTALSIVGDLFESLLKRRANVKDSSQILPGHGGMFDRLDSILPVAPVALLIMGTL